MGLQALRTVRKRCPRSSLGAGDEVGVRLRDDRSVTGRVDLDHHVDSALRTVQFQAHIEVRVWLTAPAYETMSRTSAKLYVCEDEYAPLSARSVKPGISSGKL